MILQCSKNGSLVRLQVSLVRLQEASQMYDFAKPLLTSLITSLRLSVRTCKESSSCFEQHVLSLADPRTRGLAALQAAYRVFLLFVNLLGKFIKTLVAVMGQVLPVVCNRPQYKGFGVRIL